MPAIYGKRIGEGRLNLLDIDPVVQPLIHAVIRGYRYG
jgi:hypothetical protein